jgi:acyl-CoA synthetase (NDP forming)
MVGLGGVYVEVFKDTTFGYAPLSRDIAQDMLEQLRSFAILQGARGSGGYDVEALIDVLGKVSQLVTDHPEIEELDINPLLILSKGRGAKVLDARIML